VRDAPENLTLAAEPRSRTDAALWSLVERREGQKQAVASVSDTTSSRTGVAMSLVHATSIVDEAIELNDQRVSMKNQMAVRAVMLGQEDMRSGTN
jgi:hypothetical protein